MKQLVLLPFVCFFMGSFFQLAQAEEKSLCLVTNDIDKEVGKIVYEIDEEQRVIKHLYKERYLNGVLLERSELNPEDLNGDGIVLHRKDKYITVRLYSNNFDPYRGGMLYLDTLYNGVNGQRKEYRMEASIEGTEAKMYYNKKAFTKMNFVAKRSGILGVIGVERVDFN